MILEDGRVLPDPQGRCKNRRADLAVAVYRREMFGRVSFWRRDIRFLQKYLRAEKTCKEIHEEILE